MAYELNHRQLETIRQLGDLLDFLRNPEKYRQIMDGTRELADRAEKAVQAFTTVEQANGYLAQAQDKLAAAQSVMATAQQQADAVKTAQAFELAEHQKQMGEASAVVAGEKRELQAQRNELQRELAEYAPRKAKLDTFEKALDKRAEELAEQERDLKARLVEMRRLAS